MTRNDVGFWLLIIGLGSLLLQLGNQAFQRKSLISPNAMDNALTVGTGLVAIGTFLLWPKIQ